MFLFNTPPCKDCKKRCMACHTVCEDYKNWKSEREKHKEETMLKQNVDKQFIAYKREFANRYFRKNKLRRK